MTSDAFATDVATFLHGPDAAAGEPLPPMAVGSERPTQPRPEPSDPVGDAERDYLDALADFGVNSAEARIAEQCWRELLRQQMNAAVLDRAPSDAGSQAVATP